MAHTPDPHRPDPSPPPAGSPEAAHKPIQEALRALLTLLPLDRLPRTGWVLRGIPAPESIAGHMLGVAQVALALGPRVQPGLDLGRILAMALVHDAPEAGSGDLPRPAARHLPPGAKRAMEAGLAAEVVAPLSQPARDAYAEYEAMETREARFVKACDDLQLGIRLLGYEIQGAQGLDEFWTAIDPDRFTEFAPCVALAEALLDTRGKRA